MSFIPPYRTPTDDYTQTSTDTSGGFYGSRYPGLPRINNMPIVGSDALFPSIQKIIERYAAMENFDPNVQGKQLAEELSKDPNVRGFTDPDSVIMNERGEVVDKEEGEEEEEEQPASGEQIPDRADPFGTEQPTGQPASGEGIPDRADPLGAMAGVDRMFPAPSPSREGYSDADANRDIDYMEGRDAVYEDFFDTYRNESYREDVETFQRSLMRTDVGTANNYLKKLLEQWDSGEGEIQNPFYDGEENLQDIEGNDLTAMQEKMLAWKAAFPATWRVLTSIFGEDMARSVDRDGFGRGHTSLFGKMPRVVVIGGQQDTEETGEETGEKTPEQEAAEQEASTGYEDPSMQEENGDALEGLFEDALGMFAPPQGPNAPSMPSPSDPPWLRKLKRIISIRNKWPPPLPGISVIFDGRGTTGRVLIPIPNLPTWVQGDGIEFPITRNGKVVITEDVKKKLDEIFKKAGQVPQDISDKLNDVITKTKEAGNDITDIYTDGEGNIFADVVDSTGKAIETLTIPITTLIDPEGTDPGLLSWLLGNGLIVGALGVLANFLKGKGPRIGEKGTGVGVVGTGDGSTESPAGDGIGFQGTGDGENIPGDDNPLSGVGGGGVEPVPGGGNPLSGVGGGGVEPVPGDGNPLSGVGGGGVEPVPGDGNPLSGGSGGGGEGEGESESRGLFMGLGSPTSGGYGASPEDEDEEFDPFYFGAIENIYKPVNIVMNPRARKQFSKVGIESLSVRDSILGDVLEKTKRSQNRLDKIKKEAENIGRAKMTANTGGFVQSKFPDKFNRIMGYR